MIKLINLVYGDLIVEKQTSKQKHPHWLTKKEN